MSQHRVAGILVAGALGLGCALAASAQTYLGTSPARPTEIEPFVVLVGVSGSCPGAEITAVVAAARTIEIEVFAGGCLSPPEALTVELPVGPLARGAWTLRATQGGVMLQEATVYVDFAPLELTFEPEHPRAGEALQAVLRGSGSCPGAGPVTVAGTLVSFDFSDNCPILPPDPGPFSLTVDLGDLGSGLYWVQAVRPEAYGDHPATLASRPLRVLPSFGCTPSDESLCLRNGRFRVEARWAKGTRSGTGTAVPLTEDSGSFWFFTADNVELLVKVLSACETARPRFWVFASGLTNVEVELTVTDMRSGETWSRMHPAGTPFVPILDTDAFDTCFE